MIKKTIIAGLVLFFGVDAAEPVTKKITVNKEQKIIVTLPAVGDSVIYEMTFPFAQKHKYVELQIHSQDSKVKKGTEIVFTRHLEGDAEGRYYPVLTISTTDPINTLGRGKNGTIYLWLVNDSKTGHPMGDLRIPDLADLKDDIIFNVLQPEEIKGSSLTHTSHEELKRKKNRAHKSAAKHQKVAAK